MDKLFDLSSIEVERFKGERFSWLYLHARAPRVDGFDATADLAVALRSHPRCKRVVSTGRDLDLTFECEGFTFRLCYNTLQGTVIECDYDVTENVKDMLAPYCGIALDD